MLAIPVIFIFVAVLFLLSVKVINFIFNIRNKFRSKSKQLIFTSLSLLLWFFCQAFATLFFSYSIIKIPYFLGYESVPIENILLDRKDCEMLLENIYQIENQIYQVENHRYIEETFTSSKIRSKYQEGEKVLNSKAEQYLNLNLSSNTQNYVEQLAQTLSDKAQLFQKRIEIPENSQNLQKLRNILVKMDRVTQKRKNLINTIERQCNNL